MKKTTLTLALLLTLCGSSRLSAQSDSRPALLTDESPKFTTGNANPLLDFTFIADPTSVEYNGRLYVYGTYDTQQLDSVGPEGKNSYEHIHSLAMLSTDDMVNWTWHGIIDVGAISPWGMASWDGEVGTVHHLPRGGRRQDALLPLLLQQRHRRGHADLHLARRPVE